MASYDLLNVTLRQKNFNDGLATRELNDLKKTVSDTFKTVDRYFKETTTLTKSSPTMGAEHVYEILRSENFVEGQYLEFNYTGAGTYGEFLAYASIDRVTVELSGKKVMEYSGLTLLCYLMAINPQKDIRDYIYDISGGAGATTTAPPTSIYAFLIAPGNNGMIRTFGDNGASPSFPVGRLATNMTIKVRLRAVTELETTSGVLTLASLKLHYSKFAVKSDSGAPRTSSGRQVVYSYVYTHLLDSSYIRSQTSGSTDVINISNVITDGDLQMVGFFSVIDGEYVTKVQHYESQAIEEVKLTFKGGKEIYEQSTALQGNLLALKNFKEINKFSNANKTAFYLMPISANYAWLPNALGASGANLNLEEVNITVKAVATDTAKFHVFSAFKSVIQIYSDRTSEEKLVF